MEPSLEEIWCLSLVSIQFHLFLFPAAWAMGAMAGAGATILGHEVTPGREATHDRGTKMKKYGSLRAFLKSVFSVSLGSDYHVTLYWSKVCHIMI